MAESVFPNGFILVQLFVDKMGGLMVGYNAGRLFLFFYFSSFQARVFPKGNFQGLAE